MAIVKQVVTITGIPRIGGVLNMNYGDGTVWSVKDEHVTRYFLANTTSCV